MTFCICSRTWGYEPTPHGLLPVEVINGSRPDCPVHKEKT